LENVAVLRYKRLGVLFFVPVSQFPGKEKSMIESRRLPPIWLMGLTNSLFGLMGGFAVVTVPEMLLLAGGVVERLSPLAAAFIVAGGMMAPMLLFFAIPAPGPDRRLARESFGRFWAEVASLVEPARTW
jgi:Zn-dependent protease